MVEFLGVVNSRFSSGGCGGICCFAFVIRFAFFVCCVVGVGAQRGVSCISLLQPPLSAEIYNGERAWRWRLGASWIC